jgi:uncharacterized protein YdaU (DUF1376 family)
MTDPINIPFSLPFDWDKYIGECSRFGLTPEQQGAYMKLICTFWGNRCKPLVDDPVKMARITGFTVDRWTRKIRPGLTDLFVISEDGWSHAWIEKEWGKTVQKIAVKSANGKRGGRGHSKQVEGDLANPPQEISPEFSQTQTANHLKNNKTAKANGYVSVPFSLSTYTYTYTYKEVSKKDPPLSPPMGGMVEEDQVHPSQPITTDQPPDRMLFPVQEVSTSRRKRNAPVASPEVEAAFSEFKQVYPRRNNPHTWTLAKPLFVAAVNSGVPAETLIRTAGMYARTMKAEGKVGTAVVADARTWLSQNRWENYADFQPAPPKTHNGHHSNVTPLRNGTNGQPMPKQTRGGIQY